MIGRGIAGSGLLVSGRYKLVRYTERSRGHVPGISHQQKQGKLHKTRSAVLASYIPTVFVNLINFVKAPLVLRYSD